MPTQLDLSRISIVGTSCAGKSTLGRVLSERLGLPHVQLDTLAWGPSWQMRDDFEQRVDEAVAQSSWIIDGNYSKVRDRVWERATTVVWLNYSFGRVFTRSIRRTVRRVVRKEKLFADNVETFRGAFLDVRYGIPWWVIRTHGKLRRRYTALLTDECWSHLHVVELRNPRDTDAFVERCDNIVRTDSP